ncbi:MAG: LysR family transcriptional regulator [Gammaproteobacteria bacterium]|nr:LysR family transcriptional regulator [Gammaproteobacteria bacterium]
MKELYHHVENLNYLAIFEASARLLSFTRAAEELGISQPAVSQAVRKLEQNLGLRLFMRHHRRLALTDAGERLADTVSQSLGRILNTVESITHIAHAKHVTLAVSTAFANYWLVPRLQRFHQRYPEVDLRLQTTDKDLDLAVEGISLGVRRGKGVWSGYQSTSIARESICVVASPQFIAKHGTPSSIEQLATMNLIHLEEPHRERPKWADWFASFGYHYVDRGDGLRLNDYALVLQATMAGEGLAMGYRHVLDALFAQKLIEPVGGWRWLTGYEYFLVWSAQSKLSPDAAYVRDWIVDEVQA